MTSVVLCLSLILAQGQPRDTPNPPAATAVIRGRVLSATTGNPIRGAMVSLVPDGKEGAGAGPFAPPDVPRSSGPRLAAADDAGRFVFDGVAPGRYRLVATAGPNHGRYLPSGYGASRPNEAGQALVIAAGQEITDANIGLTTGSAIEGRVVDDTGEPIARAVVKVARLAFGSRIPQPVPVSPAQTDDLGRFRLYGLEPGAYVVLAEGQSPGFRRYAGGSSVEGEAYGFLTTYYPSSASGVDAQPVRVLPVQELSGVDIQLVRARRHSLSGTVVNSQGQPQSGNAALIHSTFGGYSSAHVPVDGAGRFSVENLDPGDYTLQVRVSKSPASQRSEFADMPLAVNSDLSDVVVVTAPGITVSGRVVFAETTAADPPALSVSLHGVRMQSPSAAFESNARVDGNLRFTFDDAFGPKLLRFASLPPGWALQAVMLGANDITDQPTVFRAEHEGQIQMIVTMKVATLEGVVKDEKGTPIADGTVYVFSEDRASWRMGSPRTHRADIRDGGRFALRGLTTGRYLAVAVSSDRFRPTSDLGEEYFEALKSAAEPLVVGDGERRTIELRIWRWPE